MSHEEKANYCKWLVLNVIKEELVCQDELLSFVQFEVQPLLGISPHRQRQALYKLEREGAFSIKPSASAGMLEAQVFSYQLKINQPKFDELYQDYEKHFSHIKTNPNHEKEKREGSLSKTQIKPEAEIHYNKNTGIGYANGKRFIFKNHQPEFVVFSHLYLNINHPITKKEILKFCQYDENRPITSEGQSYHYAKGAYFINNLAKKIRKRTGLTPDQVALNNGDLTLVGKKLKRPSK